MTKTPPPSPPPQTGNDQAPVQAMVVGASDVVAGLVSGILERDTRIEVAARPADGAEAVAGVCSAVLPLGDIAGYLNRAAGENKRL